MGKPTSDFESSAPLFQEPPGVAFQKGEIVSTQEMPVTLESQLANDIPQLKEYMDLARRAGDTDRAQAAYRQISAFTLNNHEILTRASRLATREGQAGMLGKRAMSLLDRSFVSEEDMKGLDPLTNPRSSEFWRVKNNGSKDAADLHMTDQAGVLSPYDKEVFVTARSLAEVHGTETSVSKGVSIETPTIIGYDYEKKDANAFISFAKNAKSQMRAWTGGQDLPDSQVHDLVGAVKVSFSLGGDEADRLNILRTMMQSTQTDPLKKAEEISKVSRGMAEALASPDPKVQAAMTFVGAYKLGAPLIDAYMKTVRPGSALQAREEASALVTRFHEESENLGLANHSEFLQVAIESTLVDTVSPARARGMVNTSDQTQIYLEARHAIEGMRGRREGLVPSADDKELLGDVFRTTDQAFYAASLRGDIPRDRVKDTTILKEVYMGVPNATVKGAVGLKATWDAALTQQIRKVQMRNPSLDPDDIRAAIITAANGGHVLDVMDSANQVGTWDKSVAGTTYQRYKNRSTSPQDPMALEMLLAISSDLEDPKSTTGALLDSLGPEQKQRTLADISILRMHNRPRGRREQKLSEAATERLPDIRKDLGSIPEIKNNLDILLAPNLLASEKKEAQTILHQSLYQFINQEKYRGDSAAHVPVPEINASRFSSVDDLAVMLAEGNALREGPLGSSLFRKRRLPTPGTVAAFEYEQAYKGVESAVAALDAKSTETKATVEAAGFDKPGFDALQKLKAVNTLFLDQVYVDKVKEEAKRWRETAKTPAEKEDADYLYSYANSNALLYDEETDQAGNVTRRKKAFRPGLPDVRVKAILMQRLQEGQVQNENTKALRLELERLTKAGLLYRKSDSEPMLPEGDLDVAGSPSAKTEATTAEDKAPSGYHWVNGKLVLSDEKNKK